MRRFGWMVLAAVLPVTGFAQEAVIRIEAKRGDDASTAAAGWSQKFDNVVTLPLPGGWTGIALGPLTPEAAESRLTELKAAGTVPADSFVTIPGDNVALTPVTATTAAVNTPDGATQPESATGTDTAQPTDTGPEIIPVTPATQPAPPPPGSFIRLQSLQTREEADAALAKWRESFPEAALWQAPGEWFGVALGPLPEATATAWLAAFKEGEVMPKDAFIADAAEMGVAVTPGKEFDLPAPGEAQEMPPLDEVQKALRWAGYYDGEIDGKSGPQTRASINKEITEQRLSADPGTAMRKLFERREAWRDSFGLSELKDEHTGISLIAPLDKLQFDRTERALSIYGPKDGSGAALILFSQQGGQQELLDMTGLVTALGWVPQPERIVEKGHVVLEGENRDHHGLSEGWVRDGRAEGFVLIWPAGDDENRQRIASEVRDSLSRHARAKNDPAPASAPEPQKQDTPEALLQPTVPGQPAAPAQPGVPVTQP